MTYKTGGVDQIVNEVSYPRYVYKIQSERLRKAKWNMSLPIGEARRNDELIALAGSQVLRWIDELNGDENVGSRVCEIRESINALKKTNNSLVGRRKMKELYSELEDLQYKPDYMCLIIDKEKDYYRAAKGFLINGIRYKRLVGTNGGIKNSTIVFVSERLEPELRRRMENDRDPSVPFVTAKLEAYKALACSASDPVSMPEGILVVNDVKTSFKEDIIYLSNSDGDEPTMELRQGEDVTINASDGFGLMSPMLAEKWSKELGLDYTSCGFNTRLSFEKGMVFSFNFHGFAEEVAGGNHVVKDAWGDEVDIRSVDLILTTSMVKLWDSYESCHDYLDKTIKNGYSFGISKICPEELESERNLNYQFIQSYNLTDHDIEDLISPTIREFHEVLGGDWRKAALYLRGSDLTDGTVLGSDNDFIKAIMADERMIEDPFVVSSIYQLMKKRIDQAKVGVIKIHGNYSVVLGDPYALCQSIFGLDVTGLLKPGEVHNRYWSDRYTEKVACFRAPMTCHNNIKILSPTSNEKISKWYRHLTACTVFNAWDTSTAALNGMDFDGDLVMLTDNHVLVSKHVDLSTLYCSQSSADKKISSEEDFIKSNIDSFGNDIGRTTNWITSMFEVQERFSSDSPEYMELAYRIQCGQLYQQDAIDKAKGIISKPMPRYWHDRFSVSKLEDEDARRMAREIVADKKPYFMRYIYPSLMRQYNTYIKKTDRNSLREFGKTVGELMSAHESDLTERQREFIYYYNLRMPVGTGDCIMNKICKRFESEFDSYISKSTHLNRFDYSIMKSDAEYTKTQFYAVKKLYEEFNKRLQNYAIYSSYERVDADDSAEEVALMTRDFTRDCLEVCQNESSLCNIVLDLCYKRSATKKFAWSISGDEIVKNLLSRSGKISYPAKNPDGDIEYCGHKFSVVEINIKEGEYGSHS